MGMDTIQEFKDYLEQHHAFSNGMLSSGISNYIKRNYPAFCAEAESVTGLHSDNISQQIYHIHNPSVDSICPVCGKPRKFKSFTEGYNSTCGDRECITELHRQHALQANRDEAAIQAKMRKTCQTRYGADNWFSTEQFKEKSQKTLKEKYGVDNIAKAKSVKAKKEATCIERYGSTYSLGNPEVRRKSEKTSLARFGCRCSLNNPEVQRKSQETCMQRYGAKYAVESDHVKNAIALTRKTNFYNLLINGSRLNELAEPLFTLEEYLQGGSKAKYKFKCRTCGTVFEDSLISGGLPICPTCNPPTVHVSKMEKDLVAEIKKFYDGPILENDRTAIAPKELDIYIPKYSLAIELNGLYWHSEAVEPDKTRCLSKQKACEAKGIHLLQIFEDEWLRKKDLVLSMIRNNLGIHDRSIGARECELRDISNDKKLVASFLNDNHLQGACSSSVAYGLFSGDELVSLATFGKTRFGKEADYELYRFANKCGCRVSGAFGKLFSRFRKDHPDVSVVTYSERRLFTGDVYRNNGFTELDPTPQDYWYVARGGLERLAREGFQKSRLVERYGKEYSHMTEHQIANCFGYNRIYGCGNWKFLFASPPTN